MIFPIIVPIVDIPEPEVLVHQRIEKDIKEYREWLKSIPPIPIHQLPKFIPDKEIKMDGCIRKPNIHLFKDESREN
jgi:hypothetical protein